MAQHLSNFASRPQGADYLAGTLAVKDLDDRSMQQSRIEPEAVAREPIVITAVAQDNRHDGEGPPP